jgi:acetyl-CoA acetyltransferase family protein
VEDVITGCVMQVGEQAGNIGRQAVLASDMPESVPAVTLDRKCGSAQQAIDFAAQGVIAGAYDVVIAGGVEMMSKLPMKANRIGRDSDGPGVHRRYPEGLLNQGVAAERIAAQWDLSREALDQFALESHCRAARAEDSGVMAHQIVPVQVSLPDGSNSTIARDDGIRRGTSMAQLSTLPAVYKTETMALRFPDLGWRVTAGNSSQITDGAGAALIVEERTAERLKLRPRAAITHFAVKGDDPLMMLTAIMPATRKVLLRAGISIERIDAFEVNEAFSSVVLAWQREFEVDLEKVNRYGGAIALGHPVGASGIRLMANLIAALEASGGQLGLQTMCESGGLANATLIERL